MPPPCTERSTQPMSPSSPFFFNSHDSSLSSLGASSRVPGQGNKRKRGPGRPPTARQLWQQPAMQRRLVRLYLYTDESTLNTKQISHLISAIAKSEGSPERPGVQSSTGTNVGSRIRSTQNELQRLLQKNYRELRPSSREEAHERVETFRHVRYGRVNKQRPTRISHISGTKERPEGHSRVFPPLEVPPLMPDINGTYPEVVTIPDGDTVLSSTIIDDSSNLLRYTVSTEAVDLEQRYELEGSIPREHVHLSWVRENLRSISGSICSSRACAEIRSLLSRLSSRASRQSRVDTFTSVEDPILSALQGIATNNDNTSIIRLCCQPSRTRGETCIHRKVLMAIQGQTIGPELMSDGLDAKCFTAGSGRDIWNQTVLHLAAKWAPDEVALVLLLQFIDQYPDTTTILNIKNIEGKTFMHIIAERWCYLVPQTAVITLASFCSKVARAGYMFTIPDSNGRTFFDCFLGVLFNSDVVTPCHRSQVQDGLRSFLELPSDLEFSKITATLKPTPIIGSMVWLFNDLTTLLCRKGLSELAYGFGEDSDMTTENEIHLLLRSRRLEPNDIRRLHFGLTFTNKPSINELNAYDSNGKTCIMVLIEMVTTGELDQREEGLLEAFLGCGIDLQLVDRDGNTALHYAVRAQLPMVASRLIAHGVDINARNLRGETAPTIAAVHLCSVSSLRVPDETGIRYARAHSIFVRLFKSSSRKKGQEEIKKKTVLEMWGLLQQNGQLYDEVGISRRDPETHALCENCPYYALPEHYTLPERPELESISGPSELSDINYMPEENPWDPVVFDM